MKYFSSFLLPLSWVCFRTAAQDLPAPSKIRENDDSVLCSLCGDNAMPPEKFGVVLFALEKEGGQQQITTCADLELMDLTPSQGGPEMCVTLQQHYNQVCCTTEFLNQEKLPILENVKEESASLRGFRALWIATGGGVTSSFGTTTARSSSGYNSYNSYTSPSKQSSNTVQTLSSSSSSSSQYCIDNRFTSNDALFATPGGACMCPVCTDNRSPEYLNPYIGATFYVPGGETYTNKNCAEMNSIGLGGYLTNGYCNIFQRSLVECCQ